MHEKCVVKDFYFILFDENMVLLFSNNEITCGVLYRAYRAPCHIAALFSGTWVGALLNFVALTYFVITEQ